MASTPGPRPRGRRTSERCLYGPDEVPAPKNPRRTSKRGQRRRAVRACPGTRDDAHWVHSPVPAGASNETTIISGSTSNLSGTNVRFWRYLAGAFVDKRDILQDFSQMRDAFHRYCGQMRIFAAGVGLGLTISIVVWVVTAVRVSDLGSAEGIAFRRKMVPYQIASLVITAPCLVAWVLTG